MDPRSAKTLAIAGPPSRSTHTDSGDLQLQYRAGSEDAMNGQSIDGSLAISFGFLFICLALLAAYLTVQLLTAGGRIDGYLVLFGLAAVAASALFAVRSSNTIVRSVQATAAIAERLASGDLSERYLNREAGDIRKLQDALREIGERMFKLVASVRTGTMAVASTSGFVTNDSAALSARTESQASLLEETASAMEELTSTVAHNAANAQAANRLVMAATDSADRGGRIVKSVVDTMASIKSSSIKIVDIIAVIDNIAFQTNILALNAAVEAARAGSHGKGFAVVASEVRALAQRSANAAQEIKRLIHDSVEKVGAGERLVEETGVAMNQIVDNIRRVASIMGEIAAAGQEQSTGIAEINRAVMHIEEMTQQNAQLVEDAAGSAASLEAQATALSQSVAIFKLGSREFGTADEAKAMINSAIAYLEENGRAQLLAEVNKLSRGQFIDRDLYLSVNDLESTNIVAHGNNPRLIGMSSKQLKDATGRLFVEDFVSLARSAGEGWTTYKWVHPLTKAVMLKKTYIKSAAGLILVCGFFPTQRAEAQRHAIDVPNI